MQGRFPTLRKLLLLMGDIGGTMLAAYLAINLVLLVQPVPFSTTLYYEMIPINVILIGILFNVYGLFSLAKKRYGEIFIGISLSVFYALVIMMAVSFYLREFSYSRGVLIVTAILEIIFLNIMQYIMWRIERMLAAPQKALIIGPEGECKRVIDRLMVQPQLQYKVSCISTDSEVNDDWKDILYTIDLVIICSELSLRKKAEIMEYSQQMDKQVLLMPSIYELFCSGLEIDKIDDMPFFRPQYLKLSLEQRSLKRILDILLSVSALLFLAPLFVVTAVMIKIDNKGPVFYKQIRMGRYEKEFTVYKFRSMRHNAEKESGPVMAGEEDSRITAVGKFLRRTRIDEIPQFINVLLGDMSIVGPRPERPFFVRQFKQEISEYIYRHNVKPGITGMAQVYGKYNTSAYDKLIYDLMYIQKCGAFLDFVIIIQTIRVLFMKSSTEGIKSTKMQAGLAQYKIKEKQKIISNIKD